MENDDRIRESIASALQKAGVNKPCTRCGGAVHVVESSFYLLPTAQVMGTPLTQRSAIPFAGVTCKTCGATTFHMLEILGIVGRPE